MCGSVLLEESQKALESSFTTRAGSCCMSASSSSSFRWIEMAFGNMLPIKGCHGERFKPVALFS